MSCRLLTHVMITVNADMSKVYPKIMKRRSCQVSSDILLSVFSETCGVSEIVDLSSTIVQLLWGRGKGEIWLLCLLEDDWYSRSLSIMAVSMSFVTVNGIKVFPISLTNYFSFSYKRFFLD